MLGSEVAQSLKSYGDFSDFGVTAMLDFSGKANTSNHSLGEDDTARLALSASFEYICDGSTAIIDILLFQCGYRL